LLLSKERHNFLFLRNLNAAQVICCGTSQHFYQFAGEEC